MPVVEHPVQRLEVLGRGQRGLFGIGALVDVPVLLEAVLEPGAAHELPDALGLGARQRRRLERALDQRHVGEVERQALGAEHVLDHRQVLRAALQPGGQELAQPPLEQLDVAQHAIVERNRECRGRSARGRPGRFRRSPRSAPRVERRDRQQLIDRGRFGGPLGEAVAGGQRGQLERGDAIDEPIEMLADARVGPRALRRVEQHVERRVERRLRARQMAERQFLPALLRNGDRPPRAGL